MIEEKRLKRGKNKNETAKEGEKTDAREEEGKASRQAGAGEQPCSAQDGGTLAFFLTPGF